MESDSAAETRTVANISNTPAVDESGRVEGVHTANGPAPAPAEKGDTVIADSSQAASASAASSNAPAQEAPPQAPSATGAYVIQDTFAA